MCHVRTHRPPIPSTHLPFEGHTHILMLAGRGAIEAYASCHRTKRTAANWQQRQQLLQKGRPPEWAPVSENLSIPGIPSIPSHPSVPAPEHPSILRRRRRTSPKLNCTHIKNKPSGQGWEKTDNKKRRHINISQCRVREYPCLGHPISLSPLYTPGYHRVRGILHSGKFRFQREDYPFLGFFCIAVIFFRSLL